MTIGYADAAMRGPAGMKQRWARIVEPFPSIHKLFHRIG
jgi:hypothetical protein